MADSFKDARAAWEETVGASSEQRSRMVEDLRFSNPTDPDQWEPAVYNARRNDPGGARPSFVFDQTNQYIAQVVNDSRMNKPQIQTVPANSGANEKVSEALDGLIRQIEYASSASIAYDTAQEHAARVGLGWFRIITKVVDQEANEQEIRIVRIHDPLSVHYDPSFTMPDGSDQTFGFIETMIPKAQYLRQYRKKNVNNWRTDDTGWFGENSARICEYFVQTEAKTSYIALDNPDKRVLKDGGLDEGLESVTEDQYWDVSKKTGVKMKTRHQYWDKKKSVRWYKMDGDDFLEEGTDFPSQWIPLIPVLGYETWIEGKRYLCGMVRRMMPGQRAYNMERNAELEWMASQPKSPYLVPWESVSEHQAEWANANTTNKAYLPYDHIDGQGNPLPPPQRLNPPNPGAAFQNLGQKGLADLQASIGMYKANLGAPSNETSGIAIRRREQQGDTANFHYIDNLARSMSHAGRIMVDMIPQVYDTKRAARILGIDGKSDEITIDPKMKEPVKLDGKKVASINPTTGKYDVRCKVGPAYASLREEAADSLTKIVQQSPQLMTVLGPMWARMQDWPEAEHVSKLLLAMAPPPVQALENSDVDIPPQLMMKMQAMQQQLQQAHEALQHGGQQYQLLQQQVQSKQVEIQGQAQLESVKIQGALALASAKADRQDHSDQADFVRQDHNAEKQQQRELVAQQAKAERESQYEQMKAAIATGVAASADETKREIASLEATVKLLIASIQPPQFVADEASQINSP